ncbi:MAG TPA: T9SS type A sorting domain-containing protein [Bacteroidia bacterium]|jgi:hypothetical protein
MKYSFIVSGIPLLLLNLNFQDIQAQSYIDSSAVLFTYDDAGNRIRRNVNLLGENNRITINTQRFGPKQSLTIGAFFVPTSFSVELPKLDSLASVYNFSDLNTAKEEGNEDLTSFPNPANGLVTIMDHHSNSEGVTVNMGMFDNKGKLLHQYINIQMPVTLDMSTYPAGVYTLKFLYKKEIKIARIIKK